jgi:signal transduction histidine kinase
VNETDSITSSHLLYRIGKKALQLRWYLIIIMGFIILVFEGFELYETPTIINGSRLYVFFDFFAYLFILIALIILAEIYNRLLKTHAQALKLINYKHTLSRELNKLQDGESVRNLICQKLAETGPFDEVMLCLCNKDSAIPQTSVWWSKNGEGKSPMPERFLAMEKECTQPEIGHITTGIKNTVHIRSGEPDVSETFHLPVHDHKSVIARLYFQLSPGASLTKEVSELLLNIEDEISMALITAQLRQQQAEQKVAQATTELRQLISQDLHDTIGQNVCFVQMKLDQLCQHDLGGIEQEKLFIRELESIRGLNNESHELVRGMLVSMQPGTSTSLEGLMKNYANLVSSRSGMVIRIFHHNQPRRLDMTLEHHIYFIFREVLTNIEKHAQAEDIRVNLYWGKMELLLKIVDNGKGFHPNRPPAPGHYGISIIQERARILGGQMDIQSVTGKGTSVFLRVPLSAASVE